MNGKFVKQIVILALVQYLPGPSYLSAVGRASYTHMKLKLRTQSTEILKTCLSQISNVRKFVVLRFSPEELRAILVNSSAGVHEPQVWCKFAMSSIFSEIDIQSKRENVILLEINIELFLQTLRNFDRANSHDFSIRLQSKEGETNSRAAFLALYYSNLTNNASTVNHTFRIPVSILKGGGEALLEPELPSVDLLISLPSEFSATYKRLERFRGNASKECVTVMASRRGGGYMKFVLKEQDSYKTTITWNDKLEIQKPLGATTDSLRLQAPSNDVVDENDANEDVEVTVRLRDWRMAAKTVSTCKTIILLMCNNHACAIHCLLDDESEAEMIFYIAGLRLSDLDSD